MQNSNLYFTIFQKIYEHLTILLNIQSKKKAGRPPKVSDLQLAALYITSYISNTPILTLARFLIYPSIQSWHLFRKSKSERVYKILREYWLRRITIIMMLKIVLGKKGKLIVDGTIIEVARLSRAKTKKIKRVSGKRYWVKRKRKIYSEHLKKEIEDESIYYGLLVMVVCDENGMVYDIWFHPASYHEVRSLRIRHKMSKWFRFLTENFEFMGDKGYKGCKYVKVCGDKQEKSKRQAIEAVNSQIKNFNLISRWRKIKTFVAYLYAYAIGYSFFRKSKLWR